MEFSNSIANQTVLVGAVIMLNENLNKMNLKLN